MVNVPLYASAILTSVILLNSVPTKPELAIVNEAMPAPLSVIVIVTQGGVPDGGVAPLNSWLRLNVIALAETAPTSIIAKKMPPCMVLIIVLFIKNVLLV
jgi:hypothetical protein